jgi:hypothetical protein
MHMGVYLKARYWANSDEAACGNAGTIRANQVA